jgi:hypothetical protein
MREELAYESEVLETIHERANTAKNQCFFVGFLDGIVANDRLDSTELEPLLAECEAICRLVRDEDAAEILEEAAAGHHNTPGELLDLLLQIAEVRSQYIDPGCRRSSANRLLGFCAGVNCDSIITTSEAQVLLDRLNSDHDLEGDPRIASLKHVLLDALEDGAIDPMESEEIGRHIASLVGDSYAETGIPSSEAVPVVHDRDAVDESSLNNCNIVVTGGFRFGTRREVEQRLKDFGAIVQKSPSSRRDIVIIGSGGSAHWTYKHHGGKLSKVLERRASGPAPRIYMEFQLRAIFTPAESR